VDSDPEEQPMPVAITMPAYRSGEIFMVLFNVAHTPGERIEVGYGFTTVT
jgi:hypothetical protein